MSLKSYLIRLILLCVLPLVILAAYLVRDRVRSMEAEHELAASNLVRNFATALDRNLDAQIAALQVLAGSSAMGDPRRLEELYREAMVFRDKFGSQVILADLSDTMIFNTRVPFGTKLPKMPRVKGNSSVRLAAADRKPAVGDLFVGPIARKPLVTIAVPVISTDRPTLLLLSVIEADRFQRHLAAVSLPRGWSMTLLDGKNEVVARHSLSADSSGHNSGARRFEARSSVSPWSVVLEVPRGIYRSHLRSATSALAVAILGATLVSVCGGMLASRKLAGAVASLTRDQSTATGHPLIAEIEAARSMLAAAAHAQKEAEVTARKSEEEFRTLAEAMPQIVWMTRPDGWNIYFNQQWVDYTGMTLEESHGHGWNIPFHPDDKQRAWEAWQNATRHSATYALECRLRRADGTYRWWLIRGVPHYDANGTILKWFGTCTDIEEIKQAEMAVQESKAKFEAALASTTDAVSISDAEGRFIEFNEAFATFHKFSNKHECATTFAAYPGILDMFLASGEPAPVEQWAVPRALRGETCTNEEYTLRRKDTGETWTGSYSFAPIRNSDGKIIGSVVVGRDITGIKRTEQELHKRNIEMEQFIYTVSHDLRSPLVTVKTFLGYLENDLSDGDKTRITKDIEFINSASDRMKILLDELLDISRIGRSEESGKPVPFQELVSEALAAVAGQITTEKVDIRVSEANPTLYGDRRRLLQIWQNLLENAIKYMGVQPEPLIELGVERQGGEIVFRVRDNGIGIDPKYHGKVFGIFEKLDKSSDGVGMGLTMVKRIVEFYGGDIRVESEGYAGSCFVFTLPKTIMHAESAEPP